MEKTTAKDSLYKDGDATENHPIIHTGSLKSGREVDRIGYEAGDCFLLEKHGIKRGYGTDISIALILIALVWWAVETKKVEIIEPSVKVIGPMVR